MTRRKKQAVVEPRFPLQAAVRIKVEVTDRFRLRCEARAAASAVQFDAIISAAMGETLAERKAAIDKQLNEWRENNKKLINPIGAK